MKSSLLLHGEDEYNTARKHKAEGSYESALFFLVRNCFGSMFRYNSGRLQHPRSFSYDGRTRRQGEAHQEGGLFVLLQELLSSLISDLLPSVRRSKGTFVF